MTQLAVCGGGELAGSAAFAGRPAVGLGDVQPAFGFGAGRGQGQVGVVPAPGHQQAEVLGRPGDPLGGVRRAEVPQRAPEGTVSSKRNSSSGGVRPRAR